MKKERCKICSTDRIEKDGKKCLNNDYSEPCIECENWRDGKEQTKKKNWEEEARKLIAQNMTILSETFVNHQTDPKVLIESRDELLNFIRKTREEAVEEVLQRVIKKSLDKE